MVLRTLPDVLVDQIAAGEVVERPASALKELVENALDADATQIDIDISAGGKKHLIVSDNGCAMDADDLCLATQRHATSKLPSDDLVHITTLGFRGEALPSIASVSRFSLASRKHDAPAGFELVIEGGDARPVKPCAMSPGTRAQVRDLFYAIPARLKFLKADRTEQNAILDTVKRLAMAHPHVAFTLTSETRTLLRVRPAQGDLLARNTSRLTDILGRDFVENAVPVAAEREAVALSGMIALPTFNRGTSIFQYLFVNGRPVKDKALLGAVRAAYADFLPRDRYPVLALFLTLAPDAVDVNVHPAKAEVRFREPGHVRGLIVATLRDALAAHGHRAATTISQYALGKMQAGITARSHSAPAQPTMLRRNSAFIERPAVAREHQAEAGFADVFEAPTPAYTNAADVSESARADVLTDMDAQVTEDDMPLGYARAQLHENYIVAQTVDGIVLVDQHAAHERLVYERLKGHLNTGQIARQALLVPDVVDLTSGEVAQLMDRASELEEYGLVLEPFGEGAVLVREIPAVLAGKSTQSLVRDLVDDLHDVRDPESLKEKVLAVYATKACHGSIRSGRRLNADEMNALLRQMEETPHSGQCNHGRPTYVKLSLVDIERLFGRRA
ncbi:MAG: DNA mismatch repair endonuclease MutL [Pseudomonadota bacterium]